MIRLTILLWLVLAAAAGGAVFSVKFQVAERESELRRLNRDIVQHQEAIHVLRAEWSYLNRLDRVKELAARHLPDLQPVGDKQMAGLRQGLPPFGPDHGTPSPDGGRSMLANLPVGQGSSNPAPAKQEKPR